MNPFPTSASFSNNTVGAASTTWNNNEVFSFQQPTNPWPPPPFAWNGNNYNPQPRADPWNQWKPQEIPVLPPQNIPNTSKGRKGRKKRRKAKKQIINTVAIDQTTQPKQQVPTTSTVKVLALRKDYTWLSIPTSATDVEPHFQEFKKLLKKFSLDPNPSLFFGRLVKELIMCSKNYDYIFDIQKFIQANLKDNGDRNLIIAELRSPNRRMRIFWLLGEIFRPEYDACFQTVRQFFKAEELFQGFLSECTVSPFFFTELQVIWDYWKKYVPGNNMQRIAYSRFNSANKNIVDSLPIHSTCGFIYQTFLGYNEYLTLPPQRNDVNHPQNPIPISTHSNENETAQIERNQVNYDGKEESLSTGTRASNASWKPQPLISAEEDINFARKKLQLLLHKLVTVDYTDVPKAAHELMLCFLEHGNDHQLSNLICKEITNLLQETLNNAKIIRVLWVIGYLFWPKHESKLTALKPLIETTAARLFWICLSKTHKDTSSRQEMRVIFKFWQEVVHEEITSSVIFRIKDVAHSNPEANMHWVLDNKKIRKGTRIEEFYKYLIMISTAGPKSKAVAVQNLAKEENEAFAENEVSMLDKCDAIETTSNKKKWEDILSSKAKQKSDDSIHAQSRQKVRNRTTVNAMETDNIFTEFHRIPKPTKAVNLVKPFLQTTKDDNCASHGGSSTDPVNQQQQSGELSKLELFRKMMEKDEAIISIGGGQGHKWNDASLLENKDVYLRQDWTVDDFVYYVCSDEFRTSWDIVKLKSGELRVKIMRK